MLDETISLDHVINFLLGSSLRTASNHRRRRLDFSKRIRRDLIMPRCGQVVLNQHLLGLLQGHSVLYTASLDVLVTTICYTTLCTKSL